MVVNQVVNDNLRYTDWSVHCPPKGLTVEDYDKTVSYTHLIVIRSQQSCQDDTNDETYSLTG